MGYVGSYSTFSIRSFLQMSVDFNWLFLRKAEFTWSGYLIADPSDIARALARSHGRPSSKERRALESEVAEIEARGENPRDYIGADYDSFVKCEDTPGTPRASLGLWERGNLKYAEAQWP
eukprot:9489879-Pyramimonas_sp.AAC.1